MSFNTWIRTLSSHGCKWPGRFPRFQAGRRPVRAVRLQVEWLEARTLLSPGPGIVDTWTNPQGGNWNVSSNWSNGVPGSSDAVLIDLPRVSFIVTLSGKTSPFASLTLGRTATLQVTGGSFSANTFTNTGRFILSDGSFLANTFTNSGSFILIGGSFWANTFTNTGSFTLIGGSFYANTFSNGGSFTVSGGSFFAKSIVPINPPSSPPVLPNPLPALPKPIAVLTKPHPVLPTPPPTSRPPNNNTANGTKLFAPNSQFDTGSSTPNQTSYYSGGGSQGYAPLGGFSEGALSLGKHSEDVAFLGGTGEDDQMILLDFPVQLNLTSDDETFSTSDIAAALLIGVRPKLLPQKGSQVAPVATLLTEDSSEELKPLTATDEENPLQDCLINPLGTFHFEGSSSFRSSLKDKDSEVIIAKGIDEIESDGAKLPKTFPTLSSLIVLAGALVALCIHKYRNGKVKPAQ